MMLSLFPLILLIAAPALADEEEKKDDSLGTVIGIDLGTTYSWLVGSCVYWMLLLNLIISADSFL